MRPKKISKRNPVAALLAATLLLEKTATLRLEKAHALANIERPTSALGEPSAQHSNSADSEPHVHAPPASVWKLYVYPVVLADLGIDPEIVKVYDSMFDFARYPVLKQPMLPCNCDYEHHRVVHHPLVGLASAAECLGHLTSDKSEADLFFLPVSAALLCAAASFVTGIEHKDSEPPDHSVQWICEEYNAVLDWLFAENSWKQGAGKNHIFLMDNFDLGFYGISQSVIHTVEAKLGNSIVLTKEDRGAKEETWSGCRVMIIPYYVARELWLVNPDAKKTTLVTFIGSPTKGCHLIDCSKWQSDRIREAISKELRSAGDEAFVSGIGSSIAERASVSFSDMIEAYKASLFCVVPPGDTYNAKRLFSVLLAGCIPVIINDNVQLPFANTFHSWDEFTVRIDESVFLEHGLLKFLQEISNDGNVVAMLQKAGQNARLTLSYSLEPCSANSTEDDAQTQMVQELGAFVQ